MTSRVAAIALAGALLILLTGPDPRPINGRGLFAYMTPTSFVVMDERGRLAKEEGVYDEFSADIVWSSEGRYVSSLSVPDSEGETGDRELVSVDTWTGESRRYRCPHCFSVAPVGRNSVMATQNDRDSLFLQGVLRFDLGLDGPPTSLAIDDLLIVETFPLRVVEGTHDSVLAIAMGGDRAHFFTVEQDGSARRIDFGPSLFVERRADGALQRAEARVFGQVVEAVYANDGRVYYALTSMGRSSRDGCPASSAVYLVQPDTGAVFETDISVPGSEGGTFAGDVYARVLDLWWGIDGGLHAVLDSGLCSPKSGTHDVSPSLWRLVRGSWQAVDDRAEPIMGMRHLDDETRLVITVAEDPDTSAGDLYIEYGRERHLVAEGVLRVDTPNMGRCVLGESGSHTWCDGERDLDYGTSRTARTTDVPSTEPSPSASPLETFGPSVAESECSDTAFSDYLRDTGDFIESPEVRAICRSGFAYVLVIGEGPMLYQGSQDLLFSGSSGNWILLGGGPGSFGQFVPADIEALGLDPVVIDELFPEMDLIP